MQLGIKKWLHWRGIDRHNKNPCYLSRALMGLSLLRQHVIDDSGRVVDLYETEGIEQP